MNTTEAIREADAGVADSPDSFAGACSSGHGLSAESFAALIEPHLPALVSTARAVLRCEHHAWDAVQETLLALWRAPHRPPCLRGWLLRTVTYRSLQLRRCCARRRHREEAVCRPERGEDPACAVDRREFLSLFEAACARLPDDLREVLVLREVEQLDYEAIARRMGIPVGTVRCRLSRSRSALRGLLGALRN